MPTGFLYCIRPGHSGAPPAGLLVPEPWHACAERVLAEEHRTRAVSHSISGSFPILQQCPDSLTALAALEFTFTKILCLYQEGRLPKEVVTRKQLLPEKELLQLDA